ncbi:MAG: diguanylate cyclase [Desulfobacteraceae bacterium]|nr:diguanylate cyclase [Desulfobacteraceae bacterium]
MEIIGGYRLTEKISESRLSELFRAERRNDGLRVVIRFLRAPALSAAEAARFRKGFGNIANLEIEGIVRLYELIEHEDGFAIVMEDFRGGSLKSRIGPAGMDVGQALDIAIRLAGILGRIHEKGLVHKALKPSNILINEMPDSCRITDFGALSIITKENEDIYAPGVISGTLPYMAPEQTGRMNRRVDRRTDLYCLGAVFYEMLTGVAVFVSDDPMEIIHCHIARIPAAPSEVKHGIPGALSDVVMKLLLKAPEDRYQSAYGLLADLEHCRRMLAEKGRVEPFELARRDMFLDFDSPGRLVGRENETASLKKCFDRVMEFRKPGVSILTGPEGIGKSALAETVCSSVALESGYFIAGRYDQFRREVPYSAIIQAFMSLVSRLLAEGPERIESWRKRISEALGSSGRVITEVIPNLELIVGQQPEVPELGPGAARNRFVHVFTNFVQTFASSAHPLILFLDDLQWADRESLGFLARLVEGMDKGCMWLVLAYRNTESGVTDLLVRTIGEIENTVENVVRVDLGTLDREAVCSMISGMLKNGVDAAAPLAAVVHEKTGGSPFFVSQFLKNLYEKDCLNFDPSRGWLWDEEQILGLEVTDNVVELMTGKLSGLPGETRDILKTGACIGNRFDLETLAAVRGMSMDEVTDAVEPALKSGYLHYTGEMCRFVHDRLWEAAYALISAQERSRLHHDIGWYVYRGMENQEELYKNIFFIINHLNAGRDSITSEWERKELARLNLLAGEKSRDTAAYQSALACLRIGISLLDNDAWQQDYTLALKLYTEEARAAYLNADFDEMEERVRQIVHNARTVLDMIDAREIQIQAYLARRKIAEAVGLAYAVLESLGVRLPHRASSARRIWELLGVRMVLRGKSDYEIVNYRPMDDPYAKAAVRIATSALIAFYIGGYTTDMTILILRMVRICFSKGVCAQTPHWLASYSGMLFAMNRLDEARRFGDLALEMAKRLGSREIQIRYLVYAQTRHWRDPLAECCRDILENYRRALEFGDVDYSAYSAGQYCHLAFGAGRRLDVLARETESYGSVIRRYGQMVPLHLILILQQVIGKLRGDPENFEAPEGQAHSDEALIPDMIRAGERAGLFLVYTYRLMICFIFGEHEKAEQNAEKAKTYLDAGVGLYMFAVFYFYRALNQLAVFGRLPDSRKKEEWRKIEKAASRLRLWAAYGPCNHGHKLDLVEAEMARVRGEPLNAENLYHRAADRARENGFIQVEALACELAALFYLQRGMRDFASLFMVRAYECYKKWGASAKAEQLEKNRAELLRGPVIRLSEGPEIDRISGVERRPGLDLSTVIKAYQAISGEIILERLLEKLMRIGLENAGGQRGVLLLEDEGRLYVEAETNSSGNVKVLESVPVENYSRIPAAIVSYVHKTMENIVIDNASSDERFCRDPYILENSVKSVLCAPIRRGKELSGLFYVENNLAPGAFSNQRLDLLILLSAQSAIAIENAKLFEMARRDGLTGLVNHRYFRYSLEKELRRASGESHPVWLFMLDIDLFKDFNDTYGHQAGDEVLRQVAGIIQTNSPDRDLVSRYGGEEFAVICPEKPLDEAKRLAEKIRMDIESNVTHYRGRDLKVTISIGIAGTFLAGATSADSLIRMADSALYTAKTKGRNRVAVYG